MVFNDPQGFYSKEEGAYRSWTLETPVRIPLGASIYVPVFVCCMWFADPPYKESYPNME
jgi:hypothetical protein